MKDKYIYSAKHADAVVSRRRSESRKGVRISDDKKQEMDELITRLVKKGQPLTHIYAEHESEMPVCLRTLYNYIDDGELTIKNIDLRRKTGYKQRKKGHQPSLGFANMEFRQGRTYTDFEYAMKVKYTEGEVVEMDTVKGVREQGKRLLTMIFRKNNVMLLFLMPDGKAESVKRVFDYLEAGLGIEVFRRLFPVILTDNGSEFKKADELELTSDETGFLVYRTSLFYCDPKASWQKGCKSLADRTKTNDKMQKALKTKDDEAYAKAACESWIDVRAFGQVFAFKGNSVSVGVRGPVTIQSAFSVDPIDIESIQITKSVNSETSHDTMGMKHRVNFALYTVKGSINHQLAEKTGFSDEDAEKIKEALRTLFENDASSARPDGSMEVVKVYWWKHNCPMGQYSSAKVHRLLKIEKKTEFPKSIDDYEFTLNSLPGLEVEIIEGI